MTKTNLISLIALLILVVAIPAYGMMEPVRMVEAKADLRDQHIKETIQVYLDNCALCHEVDGLGSEAMPALNSEALAGASEQALFNTIAKAAHGSGMAAWHVAEGGSLNDYEVNGLVTLIRTSAWKEVQRAALLNGYEKPFVPEIDSDLASWDLSGEQDPHACVECHEDPAVHQGSFGLNCAMCHDTVAWAPAALTRHPFALDHGGEGEVACETCHPVNYVAYDCYTCHNDHQEAEMEEFHVAENILEFANCAECHPTGAAGEADQLRQNEPELFGVAPVGTGASAVQTDGDR